MSAKCSSIKKPDSNGSLNFINTDETQWRDIPQKPIKYASKKRYHNAIRWTHKCPR